MSLDNTKKINRVTVNGEDLQVVGIANLQDKTIAPTTTAQKVTADSGFDGLGEVNVEAVVPSDYYKPEIILDVTPSESAQNFIPTDNQVYNQVNVGAIPNNYVGSAITKLTTQTYTPTTTDIVIDGGQYLNGSQIIKGDANLVSENIADGKEVFGITGTHKGGTTPTLITKEANENGTYKASDEGADGYSEFVVNVASSGGGGSGGGFDTTFANNTPEQIAKASAIISYNNMTSAQVAETFGWNLGDTKDITLLTGEVVQMQIIGFNHDDKTDGGKAGITLQTVKCLQTTYTMTRAASNIGGWGSCQMRTQTMATIKSNIPQDWQNIIKMVNKKYANGGGSNYSETKTVSDDLFLVAMVEVLGGTVTGEVIQDYSGEGYQYEYCQKALSVYRDKFGNNVWWTRSCPSSTQSSPKNQFGYVTKQSYGTTGSTGANGVSFAFYV